MTRALRALALTCVLVAFVGGPRANSHPLFESWRVVPFTITGLALEPNGNFLAADDGRRHRGDAYRPALIELSPVLRPLRRWPLALSGSLQGVAVAPDGTVWIAEQGEATLRHLDLARGTEIGRIAMRRGTPNALVWRNGMLLVGYRHQATLAEIDPLALDDSRPRRLIETLVDDPDQLATDGHHLFVTAGRNGEPGNVYVLTPDGRPLRTWRLPRVTAIEGIAVKGNSVWIAHDGGFHKLATPGDDRVALYQMIGP